MFSLQIFFSQNFLLLIKINTYVPSQTLYSPMPCSEQLEITVGSICKTKTVHTP